MLQPAHEPPGQVLMLPAAKWWASQGIPVIPLHHPVERNGATVCSCGEDCPSPAKHPIAALVRHGLTDATTDQALIATWWSRYPQANIGLCTGVVFDLLDIDGPDGQRHLEEMAAELGGMPRALARIVSGRPNGGHHFYVTPPGLGIFTGGKKGVPAGIDCKSTGGYVVAPPSMHMSGQRYAWLEQWGVETGDVPWETVHAYLTSREPTREAAPFVSPATLVPTGSDDPFAEAVLGRLLQEMSQAISGNRWQTMACDVAFDVARAIVGGTLDRTAAIAAVRQVALVSGLKASEVDRLPGLVDEALLKVTDPIVRRDALPPPIEAVTTPPAAKSTDVQWRTPDPLVTFLPEFPTWTLGWLKGHADEVTEDLQTPPDLVGMLMLATLAATVRGRACVRITRNWTEPLNLYIALVLAAGETKSPALARITAPLRELEKGLQEAARPQISLAEQRYRMQEKRLRQAEERAVKGSPDQRIMLEQEARQEAEALDGMTVPPLPRLLAGDITPEGLVRLLGEQGGVMASLTAEGGLFDTFAGGRYSGGLANLDAILQAHDGREPIMVDRKGGEPIRIERPCLTLGLAIQPQVLEAVGENDAARGRGFLARWLYAVPSSRVGTRTVVTPSDWVPSSADFADAITRVDGLLGRGSADFADAPYKGDFKLSSSSIDTHSDYRRDLECRRHPETGDLADIVAWANKLDGQVVRLATLLHLIDLTDPQSDIRASAKSAELPEVSDSAMWRAIAIAEYLTEHARAAHRLMSPAEGPHAGARQLLGWLRTTGLAEFSVRDAFNALRGRVLFHRTEAVQDAALQLVAKGYLVPLAQGDPKPGRPPSPRYLVNPLIAEVRP